MNKYQNGKIYKIVCDETNLTYYGSTRQKYISMRLYDHRHKKKRNQKSGIDGMTNPKIYLVEKFSCESKEELEKRERFFIENNDCINKYIPTRKKEEWIDDYKLYKKEYDKKYREKNRERLNKQKKEYDEKNKEQIKQKKKEYNKKYRQKIKETLQSQSV